MSCTSLIAYCSKNSHAFTHHFYKYIAPSPSSTRPSYTPRTQFPLCLWFSLCLLSFHSASTPHTRRTFRAGRIVNTTWCLCLVFRWFWGAIGRGRGRRWIRFWGGGLLLGLVDSQIESNRTKSLAPISASRTYARTTFTSTFSQGSTTYREALPTPETI